MEKELQDALESAGDIKTQPETGRVLVSHHFIDLGDKQDQGLDSQELDDFLQMYNLALGETSQPMATPGIRYYSVKEFWEKKFHKEELLKLGDYLETRGTLACKGEHEDLAHRFKQVCRTMEWLYCATNGGRQMVEKLAGRIVMEENTYLSVPDQASAALFYYFFIYGVYKNAMPTDSEYMAINGISQVEKELEEKTVLHMNTPDRIDEKMERDDIKTLGTCEDYMYVIEQLHRKGNEGKVILLHALALCKEFCIAANCYDTPHTLGTVRRIRNAIYELMKDDNRYMSMK